MEEIDFTKVVFEDDDGFKVLRFEDKDGEGIFEIALEKKEMFQFLSGLYTAMRNDVEYRYVINFSEVN